MAWISRGSLVIKNTKELETEACNSVAVQARENMQLVPRPRAGKFVTSTGKPELELRVGKHSTVTKRGTTCNRFQGRKICDWYQGQENLNWSCM